ncbi:hypothetical protein ACNS7O_18935 (plasmid) [Haloferacaceae archaeon DSL9]
MEQIAARVPEEIDQSIETFSDENDCSRSEAIRTLLERGVEYDRLQIENERLRNEKRTIINQRDEHTELVEYVQAERDVQRYHDRRQRMIDQAGILTRAKWWLTGVPVDD